MVLGLGLGEATWSKRCWSRSGPSLARCQWWRQGTWRAAMQAGSYKEILNWLVVWNMTFIFPYIGNNHPNWQFFFTGVETSNQHIFEIFWGVKPATSFCSPVWGVVENGAEPQIGLFETQSDGNNGIIGYYRYIPHFSGNPIYPIDSSVNLGWRLLYFTRPL